MTFERPTIILGLLFAFMWIGVSAVPMPLPIQNVPSPVQRSTRAVATPAPRTFSLESSPDEILQFYKPVEKWAQSQLKKGDKTLDIPEDEWSLARIEARDLTKQQWKASPVEKRGDVPTVPLSEMPYPSFPAQYPSW